MRNILHVHQHAVLLVLQLVLLHEQGDQLSIVLLYLVTNIVQDNLEQYRSY